MTGQYLTFTLQKGCVCSSCKLCAEGGGGCGCGWIVKPFDSDKLIAVVVKKVIG